jgi:hypothetical protein
MAKKFIDAAITETLCSLMNRIQNKILEVEG